jgi:hypothetical protein
MVVIWTSSLKKYSVEVVLSYYFYRIMNFYHNIT